jgi:MFS family permease
MSRNSRLLFIGVGALLVAAALDFSAAAVINVWVMSGPDTAPEDCAEISCGFSIDELGPLLAFLGWLLAIFGLGIAGALIALTTTLIGVLGKWQPRAASGTFLAIGLGIVAAALGPLIAVAISVALSK